MDNEIAEDLSPNIKNAVEPIIAELVEAGWGYRSIAWNDKAERTVWLRLISPKGVPIHTPCTESELPIRLKALLNSDRG